MDNASVYAVDGVLETCIYSIVNREEGGPQLVLAFPEWMEY